MRRSSSRQKGRRCRGPRWPMGMLAAAVLLLMGSNAAYPEAEKGVGRGKDAVHIVSDRLTIDSKGNTAEFVGHVRVVLSDMTITADRVRIRFEGNIADTGRQPTDESAFEEIVASGHVALEHEGKTAVAQRAVYSGGQQTLVLSGKDTKVTMEESTVTGSEIVFHRADGRIEVVGQGEDRVEAVFYSPEEAVAQEEDGDPGS